MRLVAQKVVDQTQFLAGNLKSSPINQHLIKSPGLSVDALRQRA